ncbi:MAG: TonB family protein [Luteimonas sp.]
MTHVLIEWLFASALAGAAALLLILTLRHPLRALFGARVAYMAWALVPLGVLTVSLPARVIEGTRFELIGASMQPGVRVGVATALQTIATARELTANGIGATSIVIVWLLGTLAFSMWFWRRQIKFVSKLGMLVARQDGLFSANTTSDCPAVVGAWRPRIVLPRDFDTRYPYPQSQLVLVHERIHLERGDVQVNLLAVTLRCVYWFNPLLHWAATRFRFDQELACDALVIERFPQSRRAYADAMLKTQLAVLGLPVGCYWQSSQSLKERILMLKRPSPSLLRRASGAIAVCILLVGSSYATWALQPSNDVAPSYRGYVEQNAVAIANIEVPDGMRLDISGPSMSMGRNKSLNVMLDPHIDLRIASMDPAKPWTLRLRGSGTAEAPRVTSTLERGGRIVRETVVPVPMGQPTRLMTADLVDLMGRSPQILLARLRADRIVGVETYGDPNNRQLAMQRDADGGYRQIEPIRAYDSRFKAETGSAMLSLLVAADGRVQDVDVEQVDPAGAVDRSAVRDLVIHNLYAPHYVDGKPVASRIRVPLQFWRDAPPILPVSRARMKNNASSTNTPAPSYPADATAKKQGGYVLLHLLVGIDGSVKDVRVVASQPKGVFDAVSVEAAKKWKLQPAIKGGKPVEGWMQVPIEFDPNAEPSSQPASNSHRE